MWFPGKAWYQSYVEKRRATFITRKHLKGITQALQQLDTEQNIVLLEDYLTRFYGVLAQVRLSSVGLS